MQKGMKERKNRVEKSNKELIDRAQNFITPLQQKQLDMGRATATDQEM